MSDDVADAMVDVTLGAPVNGMIEIAGPERIPLDEVVRRYLHATKDPRTVIADTRAGYFGAAVNDQSLTPGDNPRIGPTRFDDWLSRSTPQKYPRRVAQSIIVLLCGIAFAALCVGAASAHDTSPGKARVTLVFDRTLPNVPCKSMKGVLVEYQPGSSSSAHTHPDSAFIYATVLEGAIRSKVNRDPERVYRAGESFVELPGDHHGVSANASDTQPARLLAVFVVDTDETNLVTDDR